MSIQKILYAMLLACSMSSCVWSMEAPARDWSLYHWSPEDLMFPFPGRGILKIKYDPNEPPQHNTQF